MGSLRSIKAEYLMDEAVERHQRSWRSIHLDPLTCSHDLWLDEYGKLPLSAWECDFVDWSYFVAWMHTYEYYPGSIYPRSLETTKEVIMLIADICRHDRHLPLRYGDFIMNYFRCNPKRTFPPIRYNRHLLHYRRKIRF